MREKQFEEASILIVDDEAANVQLLERLLTKAGYLRLRGTTDSREVASVVESTPPDLILLDLHMPHHDGYAVLADLQPLLERSYVPVLVLTADITRQARERALSSGAKDFLSKPLDTTEVLLRIRNLLETRFLYLEERVLLEQTLQGSIRALTDVLALMNPAGFSRALRARERVSQLLEHLGIESRWELEVAAMLSQIGSVTLPAETVDKHYEGKPLNHSEAVAVARMPEVASKVIANIPRLEGVAMILAHQDRRFDGKGAPPDGLRGVDIPWGARVLKLVLDLDVLETRSVTEQAALEVLIEREGWYDPELIPVVARVREVEVDKQQVVEIEPRDIRTGMVLAEDIRTTTGMLLIARGQEVSERMEDRLRNSAGLLPPRKKVHVLVRDQTTQSSGVEGS